MAQACPSRPRAPRPRRLPPHIREQVQGDLRWCRRARTEVEAADERIAALTAPTTASWSYIGATKGAPGNPTCNRGIAVAAINARVRRARFAVEALDRWLPALRRDDYTLLSLLYALDEDEPRTLHEAARGARIPCGTHAEEAGLERHVDALLWHAAHALRYRLPRGRRPAWHGVLEEVGRCG